MNKTIYTASIILISFFSLAATAQSDTIIGLSTTDGINTLDSRLLFAQFRTPACKKYDVSEIGVTVDASSDAGNIKFGMYNYSLELIWESPELAVTGDAEYVKYEMPSGTLELEDQTYYYIGVMGGPVVYLASKADAVNEGTATDLSTASLGNYTGVDYPVFPDPAVFEIAWHRTVAFVLLGNSAYRSDTAAVACESFTWHGTTYTESEELTHTYTAANGCDSIVTLHLTINSLDLTVDQVGESLLAIENFEAYQWYNCDDQSPVAGETAFSFSPPETGNYSVIITEGACLDTSACTQLTIVDMLEDNHDGEVIRYYPNPTTGIIKYDQEVSKIELLSPDGKLILSRDNTGNMLDITNLKSGIYYIRMIDDKGKLLSGRIIKE